MDNIRPPLTPEETQNINVNVNIPNGRSLREYLAGQALSGMLANSFNGTYHPFEKYAVEYADRTIEELNRPKP